jgi:hypothetical protein
MGAVERSSEGWRFERLVRLALVLHIGVLTSSQQQPQPRKVSVLFTYSSSSGVEQRGGGGALQLYWRKPDGSEKPWGAPMLPHQPGQRVSSFVGDIWVVRQASTSKLLHSVVLPKPNPGSQRLSVDVATGVIVSMPAGATSVASSTVQSTEVGGVWAVEVDLGTDYGFEFSPMKVAAERRVTMTRARNLIEEARGPIDASAYGVQLSEDAVVKHFSPPGVRPDEEARLVVGSRIVAVDGVPVEHSVQRGKHGDSRGNPREQVHTQLGRVRLPAGESVWTVVIPPDHVSHRASGSRLDNPYVPPRSRQVLNDQVAVPRGLGSWEQWEADNPQYSARVYSTDPMVRTYDEFFTSDQCTEVKLAAIPSMKRANVASKTGTSCDFDNIVQSKKESLPRLPRLPEPQSKLRHVVPDRGHND